MLIKLPMCQMFCFMSGPRKHVKPRNLGIEENLKVLDTSDSRPWSSFTQSAVNIPRRRCADDLGFCTVLRKGKIELKC